MRLVFIFTILLTIFLQGCGEEQQRQPEINLDEKRNPLLVVPNPKAWEGLPMVMVISDFEQSDGIFSSFICDEINKRLSADPLDSLKELNFIDVNSRTYVFKICFSPEVDWSVDWSVGRGIYGGPGAPG